MLAHKLLDMEIILCIIGVILAVFLLKFVISFVIQLVAGGILLWILSVMVCAILVFFDIIEWSTCWCVSEWAFYIGTGLSVIYVICHLGETFSRAFDDATESSSSSSGSSHSSSSSGSSYNHKEWYGIMYRTGDTGVIDDYAGNSHKISGVYDGYIYTTDGQIWSSDGSTRIS